MSAIKSLFFLAIHTSKSWAKANNAIFRHSDLKRISLVLLGLLLLAAPGSVQAQFTYSTNGTVITLTGYTGSGGAVTISNFVTTIGTSAFYLQNGITSVTIPESVTSIGAEAFAFTSVTSVEIPASVTNWGSGAFGGCYSLINVNFADGLTTIGQEAFTNCSSLTGITIPASVTNIGEYAFSQNGLTSIIIPGSVSSIGEGAFSSCEKLASVTISNGVANIGQDAFAGCSMTSVTIPGSVISIGQGPFAACVDLTNIAVNGQSTNYTSVNGVLFDKNQTTLVEYPDGVFGSTVGGGYTIPLGVTSIGGQAFDGYKMTSVTIPDGVTNIGAGAFAGTSLTSVTIPSSVASIGDLAFGFCYYLTSVYFNGNAPTVGSSVFLSAGPPPANDDPATIYYLSCTGGWRSSFGGLPTVEIPYCIQVNVGAIGISIRYYTGSGGTVNIPATVFGLPVTSIEDNAFENLTDLTSVTIPGSVTNIGGEAFEYCFNLTNVNIFNGVTSIGTDAFYDCTNLTSVTIPGTVTSIGDGAFQFCLNLSNVTIFNGVTNIGEYAFANCASLTSVTIPNSATNIGEAAFYWSGLTSVTIPANVTGIGEGAFAACASLTMITVDTNNPAYISVDGVLFNKSETALLQYPGSRNGSYMIPSGVTSIGEGAFDGCTNLSSVTMPASLTSIGDTAFASCFALTSVYFAGNAPTVGSYAFFNFVPATAYYLPGTAGWGSTLGGVSAVLWNPLIQTTGANFGVQKNQFGFNVTGTNNFTVVVEACTNLVIPIWTPLQTVTLSDGSFYFSEPLQTNSSERFYSLQMP